jgi:acid stress-induced BolA-like protein IbaG/YrbA
MKVEDLHTCLNSAVPNAEIFIRDLTGNGDHFEAFIVSNFFEGKRSLERQRPVMDAVRELLKGPLHALTIKTYTQEEWNNQSQ